MNANAEAKEISRDEWLSGLKVGDEVLCKRYVYDGAIIRITRMTGTQIICKQGNLELKFSKESGLQIGGDRDRFAIWQPTVAIRQAMRTKALIAKLQEANWGAYGLETLEKINTLLESGKK